MNVDARRNKIVWTNKDHARKVFQFAKRTGQTSNLKKNIKTLLSIAKNMMCEVYMSYDDPQSFYFLFRRGPKGKVLMNGGLIYHGSHDGGGDGSAPTFSVCLTPTTGWSIHT